MLRLARGALVRAGTSPACEGVSPRSLLPWALFAGAMSVRLAAIAVTVGVYTAAVLEPADDSRIHVAIVQNLLAGHGFQWNGAPTAATPPLYIFMLAGLYGLFHSPAVVRLVQAGLGALGCVIFYRTLRKLSDDATAAAAAALLAVYPLLAYLAGLHLTENLFLFLLLLVLWQAVRVVEQPTVRRAAWLGALIGLAALTRAVFVAFLPFLIVWTAGVWGLRSPIGYRVFGIALACAAAVIVPWTIRNYVVLGAVIPVQGNAGVVFWAGNNPAADGGLVWPGRGTWTDGPVPDNGRYGWRGVGQAEENRRYFRASAAWITAHPGDYLALLGHKIVRLYGLTRSATGKEVRVPPAVSAFQAFFLVAAAAGLALARRRWQALWIFVVLIVFTNLTALAFSGGTRYTVPMIPSLALYAGVTLAAWMRGAVGSSGVSLSGRAS